MPTGPDGQRHSARESDKTYLQTASIKRRDPGERGNGGLMTACTQPGCTGTYNLDDYCDTCGNPAASAFVPVPAGARRNRRRHRRVSAATAASPRPADRPAPTTVPHATACVQPGCTGTIVDQYCDVCGTPANASISVAAGAGKSRGRHPRTIAPAGASPRPPDRPAPRQSLRRRPACSPGAQAASSMTTATFAALQRAQVTPYDWSQRQHRPNPSLCQQRQRQEPPLLRA